MPLSNVRSAEPVGGVGSVKPVAFTRAGLASTTQRWSTPSVNATRTAVVGFAEVSSNVGIRNVRPVSPLFVVDEKLYFAPSGMTGNGPGSTSGDAPVGSKPSLLSAGWPKLPDVATPAEAAGNALNETAS